jgi:hypothetical protein
MNVAELDCECTDPDDCECEHEIAPVAVHGEITIKEKVRTFSEAADHASYATFSFPGVAATDQPIRILAHDDKRSRAIIQCDNAAGVLIGKKEQLLGGQLQGWKQILGMQPLEIRNKQEVWAMSLGTAINVMVVNERWA